MGKYMKKSKITTDTGFTDVPEPTSLGVRTRAAKTLALKRLNEDSSLQTDSSCYLQLRSRRLEKPISLPQPKLPKSGIKETRVDSVHSVRECIGNSVSVGANSLDFEANYSTRESTPCNFGEDLEIISTPGSSTRLMRTATKDYTRDRDCMVPTASEPEEFFAYAEQQQQRLFMEKYNFDIVNDMPLAGRYEWVKVSPRTSEKQLRRYGVK